MNAATLKALQGSIVKWEKIVAGTGGDEGTDNCPLCDLFVLRDCKGCPVADTGSVGCIDTPYSAWSAVHARGLWIDTWPRYIRDDDSAIAAVLELEFLRSLLPGAK